MSTPSVATRVVEGCRRPDAAFELGGLTAHIHALDVGSEESIDVRRGDRVAPIDVLINNAGVDGRALGVADDERDVLQLSAEQ